MRREEKIYDGIIRIEHREQNETAAAAHGERVACGCSMKVRSDPIDMNDIAI